ncbi:helix-turn-helix domain-containing protein [Thalassospira sp.]|uniref:GlxA family transcriptional regulator n=1 Tax=Thalassospira sp. TaxID=1912094 RepID=UPI002611CDCE|nr:helix-turn-helix domain-containing protein [Thalassospira sp.]
MPRLPNPPRLPRLIVFILTPQTVMLDVTGPLQAFHEARDPATGTPLYRTILASSHGGPVMTDTGIALDTVALADLDPGEIHTLIAAGSDEMLDALGDANLIGWLEKYRDKITRIGSVCIGAFILGAAGMLDDRACVTHWRWCDRLQAMFPQSRVAPDPIFVRDGPVWTSAGVTTGIDMAVAMIEQDLGRDAALAVARSLIVFIRRPGGQSQFSLPLEHQANDSTGRFDDLHGWIAQNLQTRLAVEDLAEQTGMSPRNFSRTYKSATGLSPARAVELMRLEAARTALEQTDKRISQIAITCGFGDDERMRRCFVKHLGVAPSDYRERFKAIT